MRKNVLAALVAAVLGTLFAPAIAGAVTYDELRTAGGCNALPAATAPTCPQVNNLVGCLAANAQRNTCSVGAEAAARAATERVVQAAAIARTVCGTLSREASACVATTRRLQAELTVCRNQTATTANAPAANPARRTVELPVCDEQTGARLVCRVGNTVYSGNDCRSRRAQITAAGCSCPSVDGYRLASASRRYVNLSAVRAGHGDFCVRISAAGDEAVPVGFDPARFDALVTQVADHDVRLNALCQNEAECAALRQRIESARQTVAAGGSYDDSALRQDITALRGDVTRINGAVQVLCNTTEDPTRDNCHPAAAAPAAADRPSDPQRVFVTPGVGGVYGNLAGVPITMGNAGLEAMVMFNPSFGLAVGGNLLAGRFASTGITDTAGGYAFHAEARYRFLIGTRFAAVGLGYQRLDFGSMGATEVNNVTEVARFGDYLGHANLATATFSVRLVGPLGLRARAAVGVGSAVVGDANGTFGVVEGLTAQGGLELVINN